MEEPFAGYLLTEDDILEQGAWVACIALGKKKDGNTRFRVNYGTLNAATFKDSFPLNRIDESPELLSVASSFSTLDICSGYLKVDVDS